MTVGELRAELEQYDDNVNVRLAMQPAWPFEYSIGYDLAFDQENQILYIPEGQQLDYLPGEIRDQLGWRR